MGTLLRRVWYLLRYRRLEADLAEEIEAHRVMAQSALEARGVAPHEAAASARRTLGNDLSARERARDVWIWPWLQDIGQDVRFAARLLIKDRGLAATAILVLGIGAGVNTALFGIFNAYCIAGVPIQRADRVIHLSTHDLRQQERGLSFRDIDDLRTSDLASVTGIAAFTGDSVSLGDEGRAPDRVFRASMSASGFSSSGAIPMLGRDFRADDDRPGAPATVILSARVWESRYAADPSVLGRTVTLNGIPTTVIGVMPSGFKFPNQADLWQPLATMVGVTEQPRDARTLGAFARLTDEASVKGAQAELTAVAGRLADAYPATNDGIGFRVEPINWRYNADITHPAWAAFVTVGTLILLIACANVANLLLTRSVSRSREIAIRASLGATRPRVVRQLLVESAVLAVLGSALGLAIARLLLVLFTLAIPERAVPYSGFVVDGLVLAVFAGALCVTVFVFGLAPALMASKTDVNRVLKDGGRGTSGPSSRRWTAAFLTAELAVTVLLLVQLGFSFRRDAELRKANELIDLTPVMTAWLTLPLERYATVDARIGFHRHLAERLAGIPEISSSAVASVLPLGGAAPQQLEIAGRPSSDAQVLPDVRTVTVSPGYFESLGLPVPRGRTFTERDGGVGDESVIVNQRFVDLHFAQADPLGHRVRIRLDQSAAFSEWLTIVGVVPTVRQRAVRELEPIAYVPFRAIAPATAAVIVRSTAERASLASRLREEVRALDNDLPLYRVMSLEAAMADADWNPRISAWMIFLINCIALGLSSVGLYAVTAHGVTQRTAEFGVRVALGARPGQLRMLVLRRAATQAAIGLLAGIVGTFAWSAFFGEQGTTVRLDLALLTAVAVVIATVAGLASLAPVRRATKVDPIASLRHE